MASFNEGVRDQAKKLIKERMAPVEQAIRGGQLKRAEYKRHAGILQGFEMALEDIDKAYTDTMKA